MAPLLAAWAVGAKAVAAITATSAVASRVLFMVLFLVDGWFGISTSPHEGIPVSARRLVQNRGVFLLGDAHSPEEAQTTIYRGLRRHKQPACQSS
jgi:hypothetical protein